MLIREFKNTNGDLDLREKGLKSIEKGILEAGKINRLTLDKNEIPQIPEFLSETQPSYLSMKYNLLTKIGPELVNFSNLREIDLSFNRLTSFLDRLTSSESAYARENFLGVTMLSLANNQLREPPVAIQFFENLKILNLSYNKLQNLSNLFAKERVNESIETIDVSNNQLTKVPMNIWKW